MRREAVGLFLRHVLTEPLGSQSGWSDAISSLTFGRAEDDSSIGVFEWGAFYSIMGLLLRCMSPRLADCVEKAFSLMTENSQDRWCVSLREVRDHINYRKNDRWPSYRFYSALQRLKSPTRYICEIFGAPQFSSFSTQSRAKPTSRLRVRTSKFPERTNLLATARHE